MKIENKNRVLSIDIARGISVILMIMMHTMLVYGNQYTQTQTWLGEASLWIGRGTAMFLITMGISFVLSRKQNFKQVFKRALYTLALGYFMNVLKFWVPEYVFGGLPESFVSAFGLTSQTLQSAVFFLLLGDILQLAGLTLLIMGIINHYTTNKYFPLTVAILIILVSKEVSGFRIKLLGLDYLSDLLFSNKFNVYFPLFPWSGFILIGMFLGRWYKELGENTSPFFNNILLLSIVFVTIGGFLNLINTSYHFGDYYHLGPGGCILLLGVNLFLLWAIHKIVKLFSTTNKVFSMLQFFSKNVTNLYIIQWIIINWGMYVIGFWNCNQTKVLVLMPIMIGLTVLVQVFLSYIKIKLSPLYSFSRSRIAT